MVVVPSPLGLMGAVQVVAVLAVVVPVEVVPVEVVLVEVLTYVAR